MTTITASGGPLAVTPANQDLPPFVLKSGESVKVTADAVSEPTFEATSFVPAIMGN